MRIAVVTNSRIWGWHTLIKTAKGFSLSAALILSSRWYFPSDKMVPDATGIQCNPVQIIFLFQLLAFNFTAEAFHFNRSTPWYYPCLSGSKTNLPLGAAAIMHKVNIARNYTWKGAIDIMTNTLHCIFKGLIKRISPCHCLKCNLFPSNCAWVITPIKLLEQMSAKPNNEEHFIPATLSRGIIQRPFRAGFRLKPSFHNCFTQT